MSGSGSRRPRLPVSLGESRQLFLRVVSILAFGLLVGITGAVLAIVVVDSIFWLGDRLSAVTAGSGGPLNVVLLLCPVAGGLVVGLMLRGMSIRRAARVADIIYGVQTRETGIPWRDGVLNTVATVIGIGSGASVGHYSPLANMGAALGTNLGRGFRYDPVLGIGCGVAAAISTAFSAPIAAVLFAHEVILRHYSLRAFAPITVASSTGFFIEHHLLARPPLFEVHVERSVFAPEFLAFVITGLACALVAVAFMHLLLASADLAERSRLPAWLRPAVAGLGVGLMAQWVPEVLGLGKDVLSGIIGGGETAPWHLGLILLAKMLATSLCIGFGFAGGVFSPSLLIGVLAGALLGHASGAVLGEMASDPALYAVCGMAAVASAVIGGPLTAVLIVFELTRNYELTIAVMISVVFANVVAYHLFGRSLYDRQLARSGFDLSLGRDRLMLQRTTVADHVTDDAVTVKSDQSLADARDGMIAAGHQECHVLDELSRYLGRLHLFDLLRIEKDADPAVETAGAHADAGHLQIRPDQAVWDALEMVQESGAQSIPVVDRGGYFIGVVYESTLVAAYFRAISNTRAEEHAA